MTTTINDKDKILQSSTIRQEYSASNYIHFSNSAPVFNVDLDNVVAPASYVITAKLAGNLTGTVTWSVDTGTISTTGQNGNIWTIAYADITTNTVVVIASLTYLGVAYSSKLTISKVKSGVSTLSVTLSNENYTFAALGDGTINSYVGSGTKISVYHGVTELTYDGTGTTNGTWKVVADGTSITPGTLTDSGSFVTVGNHSSFLLAQDTASITYTITGKTVAGSAFSITKTQTFSKAKSAYSVTAYKISSSVDVINKSNSGVYTPTTVTFSATSITGSSTPVNYSGRFIVSTSTDGTTYTNRYTSLTDQQSTTYTVLADIKYIRANLYSAGATDTLLDTETLPILTDGLNAIVFDLSNDSQNIPTLSDGTSGNFSAATTKATVYNGTTDDTANWTITTAVSTGVTITGANTRNVSVTAMTTAIDVGYVDFTATRTGYTALAARFTVAKAKNGTDGNNGIAAYLTNPTHDLLADSSGTVYTAEYAEASTSMVVKDAGTTSTGWAFHVSAISSGVSYKDADDQTARSTTGTTGTSTGIITAFPLSIASLTADSAYIDITATKTGYSNITLRFSVTRVSKGADGVSPVLVNLTGGQAISYDKDGVTPSPTTITYTASGKNVGSTVHYYRFKVDGSILGSIVSSATGTANSAAYSAPTAYFATPKIVLVEISTSATMATILDSDTLSLVATRVGAKGDNGNNGIAAYLTNPTHDLLADSSGTVYTAEYTEAKTSMEILDAGTTSTGWAYHVSAISASVSYKDADDQTARSTTGTSTGIITAFPLSIASLTADSAYIDITATKTGYSNITLRFSVTRVSKGADGVSPVLVNLTGGQAISYDKDGVTPSPTTITYTASGKNVGSTTHYYRFKVDGSILGSIVSSTTGTATSAAYSAPTAYFATPKIVLVEISTSATMATILDSDTLSLVATRVGAPGTDATGADGYAGITTRVIYYKALQSVAAITAAPEDTTGSTTLPTTPVTWLSDPPAAGVGEVVFYSYGRYNPNSVTYQSIAADTTTWSAPIAASIFQDIKSDNWGSSTPAGGDFKGSTTGYYLKRSEGSFYGSAVYLRSNCNVDIDGKLIVRGTNTGSQAVPTFTINDHSFYTVTANYGFVSENKAYTDPSTNTDIIRSAVTGYSKNQSNTTLNVGVLGIGDGDSDTEGLGSGIGVVGVGRLAGGWFEARSSLGAGIYAKASGSATKAANFTGNVAVTGNITASGTITASSTSDIRFKTNVVKIKNPLEKLRALGGYSYDWTPDYLANFTEEIGLGLVKPHDVGVIAQEVIKQLPEAVNTRQDGTLAVNYQKLIPLLIEAILELDRRVK